MSIKLKIPSCLLVIGIEGKGKYNLPSAVILSFFIPVCHYIYILCSLSNPREYRTIYQLCVYKDVRITLHLALHKIKY